MRLRPQGSICGWINLFKPVGLSSASAVNQTKRLLSLGCKVGHSGTLDPFASGVLPIALGSATRLIEYLSLESKEYEFTILFGKETTTGDNTGEVVRTSSKLPSKAEAQSVASIFLGKTLQRPPAFSAIKVNGKRAYALARSGKEVILPEREISISSLELLNFANQEAIYKVVCSTGTYIRSLAVDMSRALGTYGLVTKLLRTKVGPFCLDSCNPPSPNALLLPADFILKDMQSATLTDEELKGVKVGKKVPLNCISKPGLLAVYSGGDLVAIGEFSCDGLFSPKKVLVC